MIDLNKELAWVTFMGDNWEKQWFPVLDPITGEHLKYDDTIMRRCHAQYNGQNGVWLTYGIAPTSQMILGNASRDNI